MPASPKPFSWATPDGPAAACAGISRPSPPSCNTAGSPASTCPRSVALGGGVSNKRAEDVARAILQDIVADDLPPGYLLGSQTALIERYGASRAVFREALRLLEHHQIATMRRGPGGGLFVSRDERPRRQ